MASQWSLAPKPRIVGRLLGDILALGAAVCLGVGPATAAFGPIPPLGNYFQWMGLGFFLLLVVPSVCYVVRPGLLGGPVSWVFAAGYRYPEGPLYRVYPRLVALISLWMGLGISGHYWLLGNVAALRSDNPLSNAVFTGFLVLTFGLPQLVITVRAWRGRRRGSGW